MTYLPQPRCQLVSNDVLFAAWVLYGAAVQDLKHGHVLNAAEDALNLSDNNKRYQKQADDLARRREEEARQNPGYTDGGEIATAHAVVAQAVAVQVKCLFVRRLTASESGCQKFMCGTS